MTKFNQYLKTHGFSKRKSFWFKETTSDSVIFIKPRKSAYSDRVFIELGIYFHFNSTAAYDIDLCQLVSRAGRIIPEALNWTKGDLEHFTSTLEDNFPSILSELETVSNVYYLKDHFPDNFDHDKWWLARIKTADFIELLAKQN